MKEVMKLDGHTFELSNEDKILFPKSKITKGELIEYYKKVAPHMLPYLHNRPLSMQRFPEGIGHAGFFQKNAGDYFPSWIKTVTIAKKEGGSVEYVLCNNAATLIYLANQACIVFHPMLCMVPKIHTPRYLIFDLDPGRASFDMVRKTAQYIKKLLDELNVPAFVMTTGAHGLHVVTPLKAGHTFDEVKSFAHDIATALVHRYPKEVTIALQKAKRGTRVFIDTLRNAFSALAVCPYSVRAREDAPVATPLSWDEVGKKSLRPDLYTVRSLFKRLGKKKDPWHTVKSSACSLRAAHKKLEKIMRMSTEKET